MRKQRKPHVYERKGKLYYRLRWTTNGKRRERWLPLPGAEHSEEFDRAYWSYRSGTAEVLQEAPTTNWEALIRLYRASARYRKLADGTRRKYIPVLETLREKNGRRDIRQVSRADVRAVHEKLSETPRKADLYVQVMRMLFTFAERELEWIDRNPAAGIELYGPQREFEPWPQVALDAYDSAARALGSEIGLTVRMLAAGTGQRAGDLCAMAWDHYDGAAIAVRQEKTDERLWVACPPTLRAYLDALPRRGRYMLAKNLTEPLGYDAVYREIGKVRAKAGKVCEGLVPHGWRYNAAVELAETGASDAEIQAVTGHKTAAMAAKYRRRASQRKLSERAQNRRK